MDFARLVSVVAVFGLLINGYGLAMSAIDRMKELVLVTASIQLLAFLSGILAIYIFDLDAVALPLAMIFGMIVLLCAVPLNFGSQLGFSVSRWLREIFAPCTIITGIALAAALITQGFMTQGLVRLIFVIGVVSLSLLLSIYFIGSNDSERRILGRVFSNIIARVR